MEKVKTMITGVVALMLMLPGQGLGPEKGKAAAPAMVPLFDGKSLEGWNEPMADSPADWEVNNGILEGRGGGRGAPALLVTQRQDFVNYRLRVVFGFHEPGGGGIELRRSGENNVTTSYWVSACVAPDWQAKERPVGNVTKIKGFHYGNPLPPARQSARLTLGVNRWHTIDISVIGNKVTTVVNGSKLDEYVDRKQSNRRGGSALLCRGDSVMQFKSVLIEELPE
jgi:hypothetical protein